MHQVETAITLVNGILENVDRKDDWDLEEANERSIKINAFREGEIFGQHRVRYESDIDTIEIFHDAHTRDGFALGAIIAAKWIIGKEGVYSMKNLLEV